MPPIEYRGGIKVQYSSEREMWKTNQQSEGKKIKLRIGEQVEKRRVKILKL